MAPFWEGVLAGAVGNRFFTSRFRLITNVIGNVVVIGLGVRIVVMAVSSWQLAISQNPGAKHRLR